MKVKINLFVLCMLSILNFSNVLAERYTVEVKGNQSWTNTNINLSDGDQLYTVAFGAITYGTGVDIREILGPAGEASNWTTGVQITGPKNCLIGKIGSSGSPFVIGGPVFARSVQSSGTLYLGINDDYTETNLGSFLVDVFVNEDGFMNFGTSNNIIEVKTNQWTNTNISFSNGESTTIMAFGIGTYGSGTDPREALSPAGQASNLSTGVQIPGPKNCLIGRIGSGSKFIIGGPISVITASTNGYLELGVNDDYIDTNMGSFLVYIFKPTLNKVQENGYGDINVFKLYQNYPNPFNPTTRIEYTVLKPGIISLIVYNINGQEVCRLVQQYHSQGEYSVEWDGTDNGGTLVPSGTYIYHCKSLDNGQLFSRRMIIVR